MKNISMGMMLSSLLFIQVGCGEEGASNAPAGNPSAEAMKTMMNTPKGGTGHEGAEAAKEGAEAAKEGVEAAKEGAEAAKEGAEAAKEGVEAAKEGAEAAKEGAEAAKAP